MESRRRPYPAAPMRGGLLLLGTWLLYVGSTTCQDTFSIEGRVRTEYRDSLPSGVTVRLEMSDGVLVGQQPVSPGGRFGFDGLPKKNYRLIATAEGFQPTQKEIDVRHLVSKVFVELILLDRSMKGRHSYSTLPPRTDSLAPKSARKEYEKGARSLGSGNLPQAKAHFEKAVAEYPCYARAQTDLALLVSERQEFPQAETALRKAIECDPGFLDAYFRLGLLLNAQKKFAESAALLQDGLRRSPGTWQLHYEMAVTFYGLGEYSKAEDEYLRASSQNPASPPGLHAELANVYLKERAYDKAYAEMRAYLRSVPDGPLVPYVRKTMQQLEASGVLRAGQPQNSEPSSTKP